MLTVSVLLPNDHYPDFMVVTSSRSLSLFKIVLSLYQAYTPRTCLQLFAGFKTSKWNHAVCLHLPFLIVCDIHPCCCVAACFPCWVVFLCKCPVAYISTFLFMDTWLIPAWGDYESCGYEHLPTCLEYFACAAVNSFEQVRAFLFGTKSEWNYWVTQDACP